MPTKKLKTEPVQYWGMSEIAAYIGRGSVNAMSKTVLPPPDAVIGGTEGRDPWRGWLPETIKEWHANRPGRGRWGAR